MNISWLVGKEGRKLQGVISDLVQTLGRSFCNLSTEEGWSTLDSKHCHNAKQIASWCPREVPIGSGKISCKDDMSKDMAQKHSTLGNRSPGRNIKHLEGWSGEPAAVTRPCLGSIYVCTYPPTDSPLHTLVHMQISLHIDIFSGNL